MRIPGTLPLRIAAFLISALLPLTLGGAESAKKASPGVRPLPDPPGIHNLFKLGTNVYSGSAPEGEAGFAALQALGIRTVITVDGTKPDVELARKHGLRYVHIPHGYDGISPQHQLQLIKAGESLPGPLFVHCHHGKHRGPAAAAVICLAREGWTPVQAEEWLTAAGTATNYAGLFETVRHFQNPTPDQLRKVPAEFPETAPVAGMVEVMVAIDNVWENLKAVRAAGYRTPQKHPDLKPANEAVILWEHYREAQRLPDARDRGEDFIERLRSAEKEAVEAERLLRRFELNSVDPQIRPQLDQSFDSLVRTCAACHKKYRDPAGIKEK